jgi:hypothetical protein
MTEEAKSQDEKSGSKSFCSDLLKRFNIDSWEQLLELAESVNPPDEQPNDSSDWCGDKEFVTDKGWKVIIFYDCGELDYISHFITPDGEELDFWEWDEHHPWRANLINWREVGDLQRLREL